MRMRKQKHFDRRWDAAAEKFLVEQPEEQGGKWRGGYNGVRVELGCGKGLYLSRQAVMSPDVLFVGVEKQQAVLLSAMELAAREGLRNAVFVYGDVDDLESWFGDGEIDRLDILFCDPWPEVRRVKRRLSHRRYLEIYARLLKKNGIIAIKMKLAALSVRSASRSSTLECCDIIIPNIIIKQNDQIK